MFTKSLSIALVAAFVLTLATTGPLYAVPTKVVHHDSPFCDPLFIPTNVDEIGDPAFGFPTDESLDHYATTVQQPVCFFTDDAAVPDALVGIVNLTGRDLTEVWYIASNETRISNIDGYANDIGFSLADAVDNEAFRIDNDISDPGGLHHPLISESGLANGIWEDGETWEFILQDYGNALGLPADALISVGVADASDAAAGLVSSSGSIIAIPTVVPEPATAVLALLGMSVLGFSSRRKRG